LELNLLLLLPLLLLLVEVYSERRLLLETQLEEDYLDNLQSPLGRVHRQVFHHHLVEDCLVRAQALPLTLLPHQQLEEGCSHSATNPLLRPPPKHQKLLHHHYSALLPLLQVLRLQQHLLRRRLLVDFSVEGCLASQRRRRMSLQRLLLLYVLYVCNGFD